MTAFYVGEDAKGDAMSDPTTAPVPTTPWPRQGDAARPAVRGRVTERVVAEIQAYITANELRSGHRLPPERVFIDQLGVSRSSLREALRVLATIGLIEVRHGDGMYVAAVPEAGQPSPAAIFDATEQDALRNLVETRLGVELSATIAATTRAADEDIDQLQRYLDEESRRLESDPGYEWEPLAFELALVEVTGNSWLYDIEVMLRDAWLELSGGLRSSVGRHREWLSEHHAILASVRSRNVTQAQRLIIAHLNLERFEHDLRSWSTKLH